jgi:hypothetical protein
VPRHFLELITDYFTALGIDYRLALAKNARRFGRALELLAGVDLLEPYVSIGPAHEARCRLEIDVFVPPRIVTIAQEKRYHFVILVHGAMLVRGLRGDQASFVP